MTSPVLSAQFGTLMDNFVHDIPQSAILLDFIRPLESALIGRDFLSHTPGDTFYPLWFIAELERNTFLWRNGFSLANKVNFEFWVEVDQLIEKRQKLLGREQGPNPLSPDQLFEQVEEDTPNSDKERVYLQEFFKVYHKISQHAQVLSQVTSQIQREYLDTDKEEKPIIILPYSRNKPSS